MSAFSLTGSVRTCTVDQGWANKVQSDRFQNPNSLVCPVWNGMDTYGRYVNPDSFYTKSAGCYSADDRVLVENNQRPKYFEYVALDASGINDENYNTQNAALNKIALDDTLKKITGSIGLGNYNGTVTTGCHRTYGSDPLDVLNVQARQQHIENFANMANAKREHINNASRTK